LNISTSSTTPTTISPLVIDTSGSAGTWTLVGSTGMRVPSTGTYQVTYSAIINALNGSGSNSQNKPVGIAMQINGTTYSQSVVYGSGHYINLSTSFSLRLTAGNVLSFIASSSIHNVTFAGNSAAIPGIKPSGTYPDFVVVITRLT
jgi:hypothetical protein